MAEPFLRWVGGKRQLVPELLKHCGPKVNDYYEPFCGGAALFFALRYPNPGSTAHLNDANPDLINVYTQVRDNVETVIKALWLLDEEFKLEKEAHCDSEQRSLREFYDTIRGMFNGVEAGWATDITGADWSSLPRRAALFIALNALGFNGLCRYNKKGGFNVPCGKFAKTPVLMDKADNLRAASAALRGVEITCGDFAKAVEHARAGDAIYFDPPYIPVSATSDFTSYTADGFGGAEQVRLRDLAVALVARGVHVIVSNSDTAGTRNLWTGWHSPGRSGAPGPDVQFKLHEVQARRAVNSKADKRGKVGELIIVGRP